MRVLPSSGDEHGPATGRERKEPGGAEAGGRDTATLLVSRGRDVTTDSLPGRTRTTTGQVADLRRPFVHLPTRSRNFLFFSFFLKSFRKYAPDGKV